MEIRNPVRENPFALLGLSAEADIAEIRAASSRAIMQAKLMDGAHSAEIVRSVERAAEELRDPVRRFEHGLFWVTLTPSETLKWRANPHLATLGSVWQGIVSDEYVRIAESGDIKTRSHNMAVLSLADAIAMDSILTDSGQPIPNADSTKLWKNAFHHWAMVLRSDEFWSRMSERCLMIDDPRLSDHYLRKIRQEMPSRALRACQGFGAARLFLRDPMGASAYIKLVRESPFDASDCENCLREFYKPIADRVEHLVIEMTEEMSIVDRRISGTPERDRRTQYQVEYGKLLQTFKSRINPLLDVMMEVGDLPGNAEEHARNKASQFLRSLSVSIHNAECTSKLANEVLELAIKYVDAESLKTRFLDDKALLETSEIMKQVTVLMKKDKWDEALALVKNELRAANGPAAVKLKELHDQLCTAYATKLFNEAVSNANSRRFKTAATLLRKAFDIETNPNDRVLIQQTLRELNELSNRVPSAEKSCFIATATFGTPDHESVVALRLYRDQVMRESTAGLICIAIYKLIGPPLAWCVWHLPILRFILAPLIRRLSNRLSSRMELSFGSSTLRPDQRSPDGRSSA